jgi:hypothetical protein
MNLRDERAKAHTRLEALRKEQETIAAEMQKLQGRIGALDFLIRQEEDPHATGAWIPPVLPSMADQIREIFRENPGKAINTKLLMEHLQRKGRMVFGAAAFASVATTANRLEKAKFLQRADSKEGKAWKLKPEN